MSSKPLRAAMHKGVVPSLVGLSFSALASISSLTISMCPCSQAFGKGIEAPATWLGSTPAASARSQSSALPALIACQKDAMACCRLMRVGNGPACASAAAASAGPSEATMPCRDAATPFGCTPATASRAAVAGVGPGLVTGAATDGVGKGEEGGSTASAPGEAGDTGTSSSSGLVSTDMTAATDAAAAADGAGSAPASVFGSADA